MLSGIGSTRDPLPDDRPRACVWLVHLTTASITEYSAIYDKVSAIVLAYVGRESDCMG